MEEAESLLVEVRRPSLAGTLENADRVDRLSTVGTVAAATGLTASRQFSPVVQVAPAQELKPVPSLTRGFRHRTSSPASSMSSPGLDEKPRDAAVQNGKDENSSLTGGTPPSQGISASLPFIQGPEGRRILLSAVLLGSISYALLFGSLLAFLSAGSSSKLDIGFHKIAETTCGTAFFFYLVAVILSSEATRSCTAAVGALCFGATWVTLRMNGPPYGGLDFRSMHAHWLLAAPSLAALWGLKASVPLKEVTMVASNAAVSVLLLLSWTICPRALAFFIVLPSALVAFVYAARGVLQALNAGFRPDDAGLDWIPMMLALTWSSPFIMLMLVNLWQPALAIVKYLLLALLACTAVLVGPTLFAELPLDNEDSLVQLSAVKALHSSLQAMVAQCSSVIQQTGGNLAGPVRKSVAGMRTSARRLQMMLNGIVDVSTPTGNKEVEVPVQQEKVNLKDIIEDVVDIVRPELQSSVQLVTDISPTLPDVLGDEARLTSMVYHLLHNAVEFTFTGTITVKAHRTAGGENIAFTVSDTGVGIPKDKRELLFRSTSGTLKPFPSPARTPRKQVVRLGPSGLSIVKAIVTAHNGTIDVKSTPGKGSSFTAILPVHEEDLQEKKPSLGDRHGQEEWMPSPSPRGLLKSVTRVNNRNLTRKPHSEVYGGVPLILSVDDDRFNHRIIENILNKSGQPYKIATATDGLKCLEFLEEKPYLPDVILLDVIMPNMGGHETCARIRERYPEANIPIIMISAKSEQENIVEGLMAGSNDYVTKPFQKAEILARIETQLKLNKMWRVEMEAKNNLSLLQKMLPETIIRRLQDGQKMISDAHDDVTILFTDIVGFTTLASLISTPELVGMLNEMFTGFDELVDKHDVYKVETIGDAYMAVAGHDGKPRHVERMIQLTMEMITFVEKNIRISNGQDIQIRVGIHTGPAYAGVIGTKCPRYCFFGDTVNTASRMESNGFPMAIHVSEVTYQRLKNASYEFVPYGRRHIKGKGYMTTYLLKYGRYKEALAQQQEKELRSHLVTPHSPSSPAQSMFLAGPVPEGESSTSFGRNDAHITNASHVPDLGIAEISSASLQSGESTEVQQLPPALNDAVGNVGHRHAGSSSGLTNPVMRRNVASAPGSGGVTPKNGDMRWPPKQASTLRIDVNTTASAGRPPLSPSVRNKASEES